MTARDTNFHPSREMLNKFASGELPMGASLAISAHLELCESCQDVISDIEARAAQNWVESPDEHTDSEQHLTDLADLVSKIVEQPQVTELEPAKSTIDSIHMLDRSIRLPKVLAKAASEGLVWKQLGAGITQADVKIDDEAQCSFIYMKPGSQTPVHKHQGTETTLVLDGSMSDELGEYHKSDFILRTNKDTHQPRTEEGCLCFSVLDSPLTFTKGLARLLNPINRLRFQRAVGRTLS